MVANNYTTPTGFEIFVASDSHRKILDNASKTVKSFESMIKEDGRITEDPEFQFLVTQFAITALNDVQDLLVANRDNDKLTQNQRELLSDIYRIGSDTVPQTSITTRCSLIMNDLEEHVAKSNIPLVIDSDAELPVVSDDIMWFNIIRVFTILDIVCVTRAILCNRD